eukprot:gene32485-41233_t
MPGGVCGGVPADRREQRTLGSGRCLAEQGTAGLRAKGARSFSEIKALAAHRTATTSEASPQPAVPAAGVGPGDAPGAAMDGASAGGREALGGSEATMGPGDVDVLKEASVPGAAAAGAPAEPRAQSTLEDEGMLEEVAEEELCGLLDDDLLGLEALLVDAEGRGFAARHSGGPATPGGGASAEGGAMISETLQGAGSGPSAGAPPSCDAGGEALTTVPAERERATFEQVRCCCTGTL